jgi:hypothetical protein
MMNEKPRRVMGEGHVYLREKRWYLRNMIEGKIYNRPIRDPKKQRFS